MAMELRSSYKVRPATSMRGLLLEENLWLVQDGNTLYISKTFPPVWPWNAFGTSLPSTGFDKAINAGFVKDMGYRGLELTELGEAMMNLQQNNFESPIGPIGTTGVSGPIGCAGATGPTGPTPSSKPQSFCSSNTKKPTKNHVERFLESLLGYEQASYYHSYKSRRLRVWHLLKLIYARVRGAKN